MRYNISVVETIIQHISSNVNNKFVVNDKILSEVKIMYYNERIAWIRDCRSITQKEMAEKLNIKQQQYARYEKGINVMPITYLNPICKILNVSADYIIGITDEPKPINKK